MARPQVVVRPVGHSEREAWEPLWAGYLTFYKATLPPENSDITWMRLHDAGEPMHLLGAYVENSAQVTPKILRRAASEVFSTEAGAASHKARWPLATAAANFASL